MIYFSYFYLCVLYEYQMYAGTYGSQKTSKPLNQQLQIVLSHWMWVLGGLIVLLWKNIKCSQSLNH